MRTWQICVVSLVLGSGCVPKGRFDAAVKTAEAREREGDVARAEAAELTRKLEAAQRDNEEKGAKVVSYEEQISQDSRKLADLEKKMESLTSTNTEVGERLRLAGKTLAELATERQKLTLAMNDSRACLEALQATRARTRAAASSAPAVTPAAAKTTTTAATTAPPSEATELESCLQRALAPLTPPAPGKIQ